MDEIKMNIVKGYRFHPTDEELIEYLQIKTFDRDSLVQVIDELQDICEFEPWELAGRSSLQSGDQLWYFTYQPKYRYHNSKLISRTTLQGYWKPTGNPRKIIDSNTGMVIGTKKTLVFYRGQFNDKIKKKTCWVMHEYELKVSSPSNQKTYKLCKLKNNAGISGTEAGQSDQDSLYNLANNEAQNNSILSEGLLHPDRPSEPETSKNSNVIHNQSSSIETYAEERSNQHNMVNQDDGLNLSSNFINHVGVQKEPLHLKEVSTEQNEPTDNTGVQHCYKAIEQDDMSCNSILTDYGESVTTERSNQHNMVAAAEGFDVPFNLKYIDNDDIIPTDLLYNYNNGLSVYELSGELLEETKNSDCIQNQNITNEQVDEFLNSIFGDDHEAYLQEGNRQQCLPADDEGFNLPSNDMMVAAAECFEVPFNLNFIDNDDIVPTDLLYNYNNGLSVYELSGELLEETKNSDCIQNQNITNEQVDEFLNSISGDDHEAYLQEGNRQQCLPADDEGFNLPSNDMMESFNSMEKTRKRQRLEYDGISHHAETGKKNRLA